MTPERLAELKHLHADKTPENHADIYVDELLWLIAQHHDLTRQRDALVAVVRQVVECKLHEDEVKRVFAVVPHRVISEARAALALIPEENRR